LPAAHFCHAINSVTFAARSGLGPGLTPSGTPSTGPLIEVHQLRAVQAIDVVGAPAYDPERDYVTRSMGWFRNVKRPPWLFQRGEAGAVAHSPQAAHQGSRMAGRRVAGREHQTAARKRMVTQSSCSSLKPVMIVQTLSIAHGQDLQCMPGFMRGRGKSPAQRTPSGKNNVPSGGDRAQPSVTQRNVGLHRALDSLHRRFY